ncbi:MAG: HEAT repeat protein [Planctomycetota bacterium]|jgi:HEAT repeat protein
MVALPALALLLCAAPQAQSTDPLQNEPAPAVVRSLRLLRDSRNKDAIPQEELLQRLRQDVSAAHPALVDLLVAGRIPATREEESVQTLSVPQRDTLLEVFGSLSGSSLRSEVERLLEPEEPELMARAVAMRLITLGAGSNDLSQVFELATPAEEPRVEAALADALEWSIEYLLGTEPAATRRRLQSLAGRGSSLLLPSILRALGDDGDPAGLQVLLPIVERHTDLRVLAFAQARRMGPSGDEDLDQRFTSFLRGHLGTAEPKLARSAALVLGEFSDPGSVEQLIELLGGPAASSEAHWALGRISGLGFSLDQDRWKHWYKKEVEFFERSYDTCLRNLHGPHPGRAVEAIRELSRHRLYRHQVAVELAIALRQSAPARRRILCNALEAMGSRPSAASLVPMLDDSDPVVVEAALRALKAVTELNLPPESEAWNAAIAS